MSVSWLVLGGMVLAILLVARWIMGDLKRSGRDAERANGLKANLAASQKLQEAQAQARGESDAKRQQLGAGDLNVPFVVDAAGRRAPLVPPRPQPGLLPPDHRPPPAA